MTSKGWRVLGWVGGLLLLDTVVPRPAALARVGPLLPPTAVVAVRNHLGLAPVAASADTRDPHEAPDGHQRDELDEGDDLDDLDERDDRDGLDDGGAALARAADGDDDDDDRDHDKCAPAATTPATTVGTNDDGNGAPTPALAAATSTTATTATTSTTATTATTSTTATTATTSSTPVATATTSTTTASAVVAMPPARTTTALATTTTALATAATTTTNPATAAVPGPKAGVGDAMVVVATAAPGAAPTRRATPADARGFEFPDDTHTWDAFVDKVRGIQAGAAARTRIVHLGDSEIAGDRFVSTLRADVATRIGLGGPGFALVAPPWHWYRRAGFASLSSTGFTHRSFVFAKNPGGNFGPGGVAFDATETGARADMQLEPALVGQACSVSLVYAPAPGAGALALFADDVPVGTVSLDGAGPVTTWQHTAEACPKRFSARVTGLPARLFGWSVESGARGVVWTSLGLVGANASALSRYGAGHLGAALALLQPDLVVASYGLNLTGHGAPVPRSEGEQLVRLMAEIRATRPDTACLVMSPYPVLVQSDGTLAPSETTKRLARVQRAAAQAAGCVFLDRERLVGGPEVALEWLNQKPRYLSGDYVHLTPAGALYVSRQVSRLLLGELFGG
jgi:hypothetical protein